MNTCDICGYKVVSNKVFEKHKEGHAKETQENTVEPVVQEQIVEDVVQEVVPQAPENIQAPREDSIVVLRFAQKVELFTNGKPFITDENNEICITGENATQVAADLMRRAREAYGRSVLL